MPVVRPVSMIWLITKSFCWRQAWIWWYYNKIVIVHKIIRPAPQIRKSFRKKMCQWTVNINPDYWIIYNKNIFFIQVLPSRCDFQKFGLWWYRDRDTLSAQQPFSDRNLSVTGGFPHNKPTMPNFGVFFVVHLNKVLKKYNFCLHKPLNKRRLQRPWYLCDRRAFGDLRNLNTRVTTMME